MLKPLTVVVALLSLLASLEASAREPLIDTHAMVYFRLSFDGGSAADRRGSFGFRMDQVGFTGNRQIDYPALMQRPAMLDLKLNRDGLQSLIISGTDYLRLYRLNRADGEDQAESEGAPADGEEGEELPKYPQVGKDIGDMMTTVMENAPAGVIIGVGVGIVLLTGAGG